MEIINMKTEEWNLARELWPRDGSYKLIDNGVIKNSERIDTQPILENLGFKVIGETQNNRYYKVTIPKGWTKTEDYSDPHQIFTKVYDAEGCERIQQMYFEASGLGRIQQMMQGTIFYGFEEAFLTFLRPEDVLTDKKS